MFEEDVERKVWNLDDLNTTVCFVCRGWLVKSHLSKIHSFAVNCQHFGYLHHSLPHTSSESDYLQHLQLSCENPALSTPICLRVIA